MDSAIVTRVLLLATWLGVFATGCTSTYWKDRASDLADIPTATIVKGYGIKARVGPLMTGGGFFVDQIGLRKGPFDRADGIDYCAIVFGAEAFTNSRKSTVAESVFIGDRVFPIPFTQIPSDTHTDRGVVTTRRQAWC